MKVIPSPALRALAVYAALALALSALVLVSTACQDEAEKPEDAEANLPPAPVNLPPVPADLGVSTIPEKYPDGALTIDGLRRHRVKNLDKDVIVRGKVVNVYKCEFWEDKKKPRRRARRKEGEPEEEPKMCQRHHIHIADPQSKGAPEDRLLIVNFSELYQEKVEADELKVGDTYTILGRYTDVGDGFVETEVGLIFMAEIKEIKEAEEAKEAEKKK